MPLKWRKRSFSDIVSAISDPAVAELASDIMSAELHPSKPKMQAAKERIKQRVKQLSPKQVELAKQYAEYLSRVGRPDPETL